MKALTSESNRLFRGWLKLAAKPRSVREQGRTLAEGLHLAQAALDAGTPIGAVLVRRGASGAAIERLLESMPAGAARFELAPSLYDRIAPVEHGAGLMLQVEVRGAPPPERSTDDLVYLDAIQDPVNVGALLRSAAAAGIRHVLCSPATAAAWAPRTLRAAMGAHFRMRISEDIDALALGATLQGPWIAAVVREAPSLWDAALPATAVGWAFGSEGAGVSEAILARCALRVRIPMDGHSESLNVAAAAAICLFERRRRLAAV